MHYREHQRKLRIYYVNKKETFRRTLNIRGNSRVSPVNHRTAEKELETRGLGGTSDEYRHQAGIHRMEWRRSILPRSVLFKDDRITLK